jgi:hypothetical protein
MTENYPGERTYEELYEEIMAQIEAIEVRSRLMQWPYTTVSTAGTTTLTVNAASASSGQTYSIVTSGSHVPTKKKPVRPKVRYRAHWRKEQIERKLRSV